MKATQSCLVQPYPFPRFPLPSSVRVMPGSPFPFLRPGLAVQLRLAFGWRPSRLSLLSAEVLSLYQHIQPSVMCVTVSGVYCTHECAGAVPSQSCGRRLRTLSIFPCQSPSYYPEIGSPTEELLGSASLYPPLPALQAHTLVTCECRFFNPLSHLLSLLCFQQGPCNKLLLIK